MLFTRASWLTLLLAFAPLAAHAADIAAITLVTNDNTGAYGGMWGTNSEAAIGVLPADAGSLATDAFLDPGGALDVRSGGYLLFLGYEDRFANGAVAPFSISALLTVYYSDSTQKSATFTNSAGLNASGWWTETSGDPALALGSSGIIDVDRVGDSAAGSYAPNGAPDVVLAFSDTGDPDAPEPATLGLLALGLACLLAKARTRRSRR